jgi:hypothetical protein
VDFKERKSSKKKEISRLLFFANHPSGSLYQGGRGDFRQDRDLKENIGCWPRLWPLTNDSLKFMVHVLFKQSRVILSADPADLIKAKKS